MLNSFSRMAPELFRFSSRPDGEMLFDEHLRDAQRVLPRVVKRSADDAGCGNNNNTATKKPKHTSNSLWDDEDNHCVLDGDDEGVGATEFEIDGLCELEGLF